MECFGLYAYPVLAVAARRYMFSYVSITPTLLVWHGCCDRQIYLHGGAASSIHIDNAGAPGDRFGATESRTNRHRNLSAAAISSRANFLFGRCDSPRQEIDVEILGNRPDHVLLNVFYNPGTNGTKFDYGYRGTSVIIQLGFDASKALHRYTIEWNPDEIRWFVDLKLVHRRAIWDPTPIPHLPMTLHVNTWPTASRELAGRLARRALPASAIVRRVAVDIYDPDSRSQPAAATRQTTSKGAY